MEPLAIGDEVNNLVLGKDVSDGSKLHERLFRRFTHCVEFFSSFELPESYALIRNRIYCIFNEGHNAIVFSSEGMEVLDCGREIFFNFTCDDTDTARDLLRALIRGEDVDPYHQIVMIPSNISSFDKLVLQLNMWSSHELIAEASRVQEFYSSLVPLTLDVENIGEPSMSDLFEYYFNRVNIVHDGDKSINCLPGFISISSSTSKKLQLFNVSNTFILVVCAAAGEPWIIPCEFLRNPIPIVSLLAMQLGIDDKIDSPERRIRIDYVDLQCCASGWASHQMETRTMSAIVSYPITVDSRTTTLKDLQIIPQGLSVVWEDFDDSLYLHASFNALDYSKLCEFDLCDAFLPIRFVREFQISEVAPE